MTAAEWQERIKTACRGAGTYKDFFDDVIHTLSVILEKRDAAEDAFRKSGGNVLIRHTNKAGAVNLEQNPALRLMNDLNRDALTYWRELGLTSRSYKAMTGSLSVQVESKNLEDILAEIGA